MLYQPTGAQQHKLSTQVHGTAAFNFMFKLLVSTVLPSAEAKQPQATVRWQGGNLLGRHPATPTAGTLVQ